MNQKQIHALGEWCLELSALLAVFPTLELVAREGRVHEAIVLPFTCALAFGWLGIYLIGRV
jgi:hypothetical protein